MLCRQGVRHSSDKAHWVWGRDAKNVDHSIRKRGARDDKNHPGESELLFEQTRS